ncbi:enolase-phosphatase E1 [Drosophila busckii]|nr:enolase-phosphatase E1 [Drosophila busckii]
MTAAQPSLNVVLVDIEGTTTSISFVHDVLFPYAKENVQQYLQETWNSDATKDIVQDLQQTPQFAEWRSTLNSSMDTIDEPLITDFVRYLIDKDLKVTPLKTLQGLIWARGYAAGQLKGHVYEDVPAAFEAWRNAGLRVAVYSSGSVAAQKLIFHHSIAGDLLRHISAHFDTHVGHKQQTESYTKIAEALQVPPEKVIFLTDVAGEADAARAAGMQTRILQRPGNAALSEDQKSTYQLIEDFTSLQTLQLS